MVPPIGGIWRQLHTDAQSQSFPYSTVSKPFLYSESFMARSYRETNQHKQKTQYFWPARQRVKFEPEQFFSMVIEDLEHVLAALKLLGGPTHILCR